MSKVYERVDLLTYRQVTLQQANAAFLRRETVYINEVNDSYRFMTHLNIMDVTCKQFTANIPKGKVEFFLRRRVG